VSTSFLPDTDAARSAVAKLFAEKPPVLVEFRFPHMGTSSVWFLCDDCNGLDPIPERLGPGAEVRLSSVWDVTNPAGPVVFRR